MLKANAEAEEQCTHKQELKIYKLKIKIKRIVENAFYLKFEAKQTEVNLQLEIGRVAPLERMKKLVKTVKCLNEETCEEQHTQFKATQQNVLSLVLVMSPALTKQCIKCITIKKM